MDVDQESMSDKEYQGWIMEQVPVGDRPHLAEMFKRQDSFKEHLAPVQQQALDFEVATTYAQMVTMTGGEDKLSRSQKSAMRRNAELVSIMQWGMGESAEQQMAEVRKMLRGNGEKQDSVTVKNLRPKRIDVCKKPCAN